jgi:hypothetical protein
LISFALIQVLKLWRIEMGRRWGLILLLCGRI